MIIGNFSTENPTQRVMEVIGEWYLNHRSREHLKRLAKDAGISDQFIDVDKEPLGINLFLRVGAEILMDKNNISLTERKASISIGVSKKYSVGVPELSDQGI